MYNLLLTGIEKKIESTVDRIGSQIPYIPSKSGLYETDMSKENLAWWTNGFYAGIMWELYLCTKNDKYKKIANEVEEKFDVLFGDEVMTLDHDIGFLWLHTSVANYRITGNEQSKIRAIHAANMLAARFNANGSYLVAWNNDDRHMIIDSLMNIPLLFWATEETGDQRFKSIAEKHLNTAEQYILREDGSCNHICVFDSTSGEFIESIGGQGYGVNSSWTRGQAWGVYGFTLAYEHTGAEKYLNAAKKVANYFMANIIKYDFVTPVDFRSPIEPMIHDTTSSAIVASGLVELAKYVTKSEAENMMYVSEKIISKLEKEFIDLELTNDGVVKKGSAKYHNDKVDPEIPIIYGDYFFIEALMKHQKYEINMW
ncbi:MAG: glycoside hydrolase family 88 protein [Coprobacillaceae bacterium]